MQSVSSLHQDRVVIPLSQDHVLDLDPPLSDVGGGHNPELPSDSPGPGESSRTQHWLPVLLSRLPGPRGRQSGKREI